MEHDKELNTRYSDLEGLIDLNKSILDNLQSIPLTEGYQILITPQFQDALTFFEDELESLVEELDFWEEDKILRDFFND